MANDLEQQLGAILNDPGMMQKIMSVAKNISQAPPESPPKEPAQQPDIDFALLQKFSGMISQSGIDQQQKSLLSALSPFLSKDRIRRLENAMRAARMTKLATTVINSSKSSR